jgi:hypothetical protein
VARTAIATVGTQTLPSLKLKLHQDMDPIAETVPAAIAAMHARQAQRPANCSSPRWMDEFLRRYHNQAEEEFAKRYG